MLLMSPEIHLILMNIFLINFIDYTVCLNSMKIKQFLFDINNKNLKTNETESNYILIIINFISISFHNVISTKI
jgi:hypothetical protein